MWKHGTIVKSIALFYHLEDEEMSGCINTPGSVLSCHCKMKLKLRKVFEIRQTNCFRKLTVETFQNEVLFLWTEADPACFVIAWKSQHTKSDIWVKCASAERYKILRCWALAPQIYPTIFQKTYAILSKLLQVSGSQVSEMTHDLHILTLHCFGSCQQAFFVSLSWTYFSFWREASSCPCENIND